MIWTHFLWDFIALKRGLLVSPALLVPKHEPNNLLFSHVYLKHVVSQIFMNTDHPLPVLLVLIKLVQIHSLRLGTLSLASNYKNRFCLFYRHIYATLSEALYCYLFLFYTSYSTINHLPRFLSPLLSLTVFIYSDYSCHFPLSVCVPSSTSSKI